MVHNNLSARAPSSKPGVVNNIVGMQPKPRPLWYRLIGFREFGILIPLVVICVGTALINPAFVSAFNIASVLQAISLTAIVAVSATFVLISGGLDLSVGSTVAVAGMVTAGLLKALEPSVAPAVNVAVSLSGGIVAGLLVGLFNGLTIVYVRIPPLIVTLGALYSARGLVEVVTGGVTIYPLPPAFLEIGQGVVLGLPIPFLIMILLAIVAHIVLVRTTCGRSVHAIGGNEATAHLSGINVARVKLSVYLISGACSALAGILLTSRIRPFNRDKGRDGS
jgi:ribose/xylose/arabinose/galactoside ABC-type transport system permease subunit